MKEAGLRDIFIDFLYARFDRVAVEVLFEVEVLCTFESCTVL